MAGLLGDLRHRLRHSRGQADLPADQLPAGLQAGLQADQLPADLQVGLQAELQADLQADQLRPRSRGAVTLRSADPRAPPKALFNYLSDEGGVDISEACSSGGVRRRGGWTYGTTLAQPASQRTYDMYCTACTYAPTIDTVGTWVCTGTDVSKKIYLFIRMYLIFE